MALTASVASTQPVCFDPYVTAMSYHQKQHRRFLRVAPQVIAFLAKQASGPLLHLALSLDQTWEAGHSADHSLTHDLNARRTVVSAPIGDPP
jgi:hypothetical protein